LLLVLVSSGVRVMEACTLRIKDVDFSINPTKISVRKEYSKTRRAREVYISDEATKYLQELINSKPSPEPDDLIFSKLKESLPRSIYFRLLTEFEKLLTASGMDKKKDNSPRRKITLHSFRRFVKGVVSDQVGSDYSEWFLGHNHSVYWTRKEPERRKIYLQKCMPHLTILDYTELDTRSKNIESAMKEKDRTIKLMANRMAEIELHQKEMSEVLQNLTPELLERIRKS
ncbi:MAG: site-specific integrase, partial [Nitrososphaeraceae archaeon]